MLLLTVPLYALTFRDGLDPRGRPMGTDFLAFWSAARVRAQGLGIDPWDLPALSTFQADALPGLADPVAWVHPPTALLLVWPLGHLPFAAAFVVWTLVGLAVFLGTLRVVVRGHRHAWPLVLAFPGLWLGIAQGQMQFVVGALLGGALLALRRHPALAGVLIGLLTVKPHLAVLLPLALLAGRQWRAIAWAAASSVASLGVSVAVLGPGTLARWFDGMGLVAASVDDGSLPVFKFVTPYTALRLLGLPYLPAIVLHAAVAVVAAAAVAVVWRRTSDVRVCGSALVVGTFLVSPYAADYDLAALAFPIAWMALLGLERGWLRGDRNLLVVTWLLPMLTGPVAALTHVCVTPVVMALLLRQLLLRSRHDGAPGAYDVAAAAQPGSGSRT